MRKVLTYSLPAVLSVSLLSAQAASSSPGRRQDQSSIRSTVVIRTDKKLTASERRALSLTGRRLLNHTERAQEAVAARNQREAIQQIEQAMRLQQIAMKAAPPYIMTVQIAAGGSVYRDREQRTIVMVPIYAEVTEVATAAAPSEGERARVAVQDVEATVGLLALDVAHAGTHLQAARQAVNANQWDRAAAALSAVHQGVVIVAETDLPLVKARQNLAIASSMMEKGQKAQARTALNEAASALQEFSRTAPAARRQAAESLAQKIRGFSDSIERRPVEQASTIDDWWNYVAEEL
ncbi:MAG: YfdX family protein [Bryobacteraceae bacterium]